LVETSRDEPQIEGLQTSLHDALDEKHPETGVDEDVVEPPIELVHQCFLDQQVLGPDTLVVRVAMADDPDHAVYFHAAEEETAKVYGEVVDSGLLAECETRTSESASVPAR
jgi:hypothetical protein